MYLLLLAVIYLAFISLGLPDSLLGAAWPTIYAEFDVPLSYMGIVTMIISAGTITSSLLTDRLTKKFGTKYVTTVSVLLTAIAMLCFSMAGEFYHLCLIAIPYGLGAGAIDASLNNYVALHYSSRHMSWLHSFWGVGTIISPYIMSYALTHSVWTDGYRIVSYIQLAIFLSLVLALPLWKINKSVDMGQTDVKPLRLIDALRIEGVIEVIVGFMAYCAAESTAMLWSSSYFEGIFALSKEDAAALGSIFFIGMTVGRFISGFISDRLGDKKMIILGTVIALGGILLMGIPFLEVSIAGFILFGLGCAPIYPSIIHSTPIRFGQERSQSIIGIQMAAAYFGATFMPPLFGLIANNVSLKLMPIYLIIFVLLVIIMMLRLDKKAG